MPQTRNFFEEVLESSDTDLESEQKVENSYTDLQPAEETSTLVQDINAQDEDGMTNLHRVAAAGPCMCTRRLREALTELFSHADLDFTIKDKHGNTPLHLAAQYCEDRDTCLFLFPNLIAEASRRGFDFSTLGGRGLTVLQIAVMTTYTSYIAGMFAFKRDNVSNVLNNAKNPGLNVLSRSGNTAFFYAIKHCQLKHASSLLDAGADPALYGAPDRNPFNMIDEHIFNYENMLNAELSDPETADGQQIKFYQNMLNELNTLKGRMLSIVAEKSVSEVNKNAMVIALGARGSFSFFNRLPPEVLIKIAGLTATNGAQTQDVAEKIAEKKIHSQSLFSPVVNTVAPVAATSIEKSHSRCVYPLSI